MFLILRKKVLAPTVTQFDVKAPFIARKRKAGNFVMIRVEEGGERIPLTIADSNPRRINHADRAGHRRNHETPHEQRRR